MKKKFLIIGSALLVLIAGGIFGYLFKTGKIKIGADTITASKTFVFSSDATKFGFNNLSVVNEAMANG